MSAWSSFRFDLPSDFAHTLQQGKTNTGKRSIAATAYADCPADRAYQDAERKDRAHRERQNAIESETKSLLLKHRSNQDDIYRRFGKSYLYIDFVTLTFKTSYVVPKQDIEDALPSNCKLINVFVHFNRGEPFTTGRIQFRSWTDGADKAIPWLLDRSVEEHGFIFTNIDLFKVDTSSQQDQARPPSSVNNQVYVGNLPFDTTSQDVIAGLCWGLRRHNLTGKNESPITLCDLKQGYALVTCDSSRTVKLLLSINGMPFYGQILKMSRPDVFRLRGPDDFVGYILARPRAGDGILR